MADNNRRVIDVAGADRETIISIILGAIVVIIIGALAFRYFQNTENGEVATPESELTEPQVVEVEELPDGEVMVEETDEGQVPANLPARYTVKEGESTWRIAEAFYGSGFNYTDIEIANDLAPEEGLVVGQVLTIPRVPVRTADTAAAPRDVTAENGAMPAEQTGGPTKGDDSAAEAALAE